MKLAVILAFLLLLAEFATAKECKAGGGGEQCSSKASDETKNTDDEPSPVVQESVQKQESQANGNNDDYVPQKCEVFDRSKFGANNASIFVVEAKGRLGNHLIAYAMVIALAKEMGVVPMVVGETHKFINQ